MKLHIQKGMALNEVIQAEVQIKDETEWDAKVKPVLKRLDQRMLELNERVIESNVKMRDMSPEWKNATMEVYAILHGEPFTQIQRREPAAEAVAEGAPVVVHPEAQ